MQSGSWMEPRVLKRPTPVSGDSTRGLASLGYRVGAWLGLHSYNVALEPDNWLATGRREMKKNKETFEELYRRLEETVAKLEEGGLPLERSLALYEEGMQLAHRCQEMLDAAEVRSASFGRHWPRRRSRKGRGGDTLDDAES